jgi:hypothetical protein
MQSLILKKALKYLLHSLLIPFILNNLDKWTTIINTKVQNLITLEKENDDET